MSDRAKLDWKPISDETPRDIDIEIMLYYSDYCNAGPLVVSGHWECQEGREFEATFAHSYGYGDPEMWAPMPKGPVE